MNYPQIVFVCTANVCRSQLAQTIALEFIQEKSPNLFQELGLQIHSFGIFTNENDSVCQIVEEQFNTSHDQIVQQFDESVINSKSLIFVMEQRQQSELVKSHPKLRSQIFLLRSAELIAKKLSEGIADNSLFDVQDIESQAGFITPPLPQAINDRWDWFVQEMDAHRGLVQYSRGEDPIGNSEIVDAHQPRSKNHKEVLSLVAETVGMLMDAVCSILGATQLVVEKFESEGMS